MLCDSIYDAYTNWLHLTPRPNACEQTPRGLLFNVVADEVMPAAAGWPRAELQGPAFDLLDRTLRIDMAFDNPYIREGTRRDHFQLYFDGHFPGLVLKHQEGQLQIVVQEYPDRKQTWWKGPARLQERLQLRLTPWHLYLARLGEPEIKLWDGTLAKPGVPMYLKFGIYTAHFPDWDPGVGLEATLFRHFAAELN